MNVSDYVFVIMCLVLSFITCLVNIFLSLFIDKRFREYLKIIEKENEDE